MTTPPRVTSDEASAAVARIARRHCRTDHPNQHLLTDDPRDVLVYLQRCSPARLLEDEESHDVDDGLVLRVWLWWEGEQFERYLLAAAEHLSMDRVRVGRHLGVRSGQGVIDRLYRKRALLDAAGPGVPSEKLYRSYRDASVPTPVVEAGPPTTGDAATAELRAAVGQLLAARHHLPDDLYESVGYLRREVSEERAELTASALAIELRDLSEEMSGRSWPLPVRAALDRVAEALVAVEIRPGA